ncbi:unnamed protein product [Periconia digitata]|uniref:Zn(2)-C6 fungal-type domain-containing protein n=1 Tax=Periconia digitata TaxID=1303443 RepID=A0A9W4USP3_9PLEO|nr:unnamed protein product [Periconia digitata]
MITPRRSDHPSLFHTFSAISQQMEDPEQPATERAVQGRVLQACQRCRSLKTRCLLSDHAGICQRCLHAKKDCVWAEVPRRARKARGPSRIAQVEQKIDGLVASIARPPTNHSSFASTSEQRTPPGDTARRIPGKSNERTVHPGSWLPFPDSFDQEASNPQQSRENGAEESQPGDELNERFLNRLRDIHTFSTETDMERAPDAVFQGAHRFEPEINNEYVKRLLSTGEAEILLNEYRAMWSSFPFVPLANHTSARDLSETKPMLFLAILTVASWKNRLRQKILDKTYRTELSERTIVNPHRTLSIVQSILVYLSRYHFLFSHKTQQIFSLQQVAVGLALDIGLHTKTRRTFMNGMSGRTPPKAYSEQEQRERQRTFLGCYYMSSMIAGGLQKPNLLRYTDYMGECCKDLRQAREIPSDVIIGRLVTLRRLDDQIHDAFYSEDAVDLSLSDPRINMNYKFLQAQLEDFGSEDCLDELQRMIDLTSTFTSVQLHSISLRQASTPTNMIAGNTLQLNALLATLEACKRHTDILLSISASEYHLLSFSEWMRLPVVMITGARLCIPSDHLSAINWDIKAAHERLRLDSFLEFLCARMQAISVSVYDFWSILNMIMRELKTWYLKRINPGSQPIDPINVFGIPTPNATMSSLGSSGATPASHAMGHGCPVDHAGQLSAETGMNLDMTEAAFAFMRSEEFDMDKFFDMGLWGDETYLDMGFGS